MYDATIHARSIARHFTPGDFVSDPTLLDEATRKSVIDAAVTIGATGFANVSFVRSSLRRKSIYQVIDISQVLVLRHISKGILRLTGVKQDNRQFLIECIRTMLKEGTSYRVYKFDIKSFFESVNPKLVLDRLKNEEGFSGQSAVALETFLRHAEGFNISGLPRGLGISSTLSEYLLTPFDEIIANSPDVWFYARFVDDIFIVTNGREDRNEFIKFASDQLPDGLQFNHKSQVYDFGPFAKNIVGLAHAVDFLGYRFYVDKPERNGNQGVMRKVTIDIAPNKVRKIKTRIALSLLQFSNDSNFSDLRARIRLLTSNFNFLDRASGIRRVSGIYFNYPLVDLKVSVAINDLDKFLRNAIMSPHLSNRLRPALALASKRELCRLTFRGGHSRKRFYSFSPQRLVELRSVWQHA